MSKLSLCACCESQLEPAQQFRFLVETDSLDNPAFLACIRMLPSINGKPVPVCGKCQAKIEATPRLSAKSAKPVVASRAVAKPQAAKMPALALGLLGMFSMGLLFGTVLNSRG